MIINWFEGQAREISGRSVVTLIQAAGQRGDLEVIRQDGRVLVHRMKEWLVDQRPAPRGQARARVAQAGQQVGQAGQARRVGIKFWKRKGEL